MNDIVTRESAAAAEAAHRVHAWLEQEGRFLSSSRELLDRWCHELTAVGVPVLRVAVLIQIIHPQLRGTGYRWRRGQAAVEANVGYNVFADPTYLESPVKIIHDGAGGVRRRLAGPNANLDFPISRELAEEGATDYVAVPLVFTDGRINVLTVATDRPEGFSRDHLKLVYECLPVLSLLFEVHTARRIASTLLDTYVGRQAGQQVLQGRIKRGDGEIIHAVIWISDLRGFTRMSDTGSLSDVIEALNAYFERVSQAIDDHGGQVLKFIGDGVFAIFPLGDIAFRHYVCRRAQQAARQAESAMVDLNRERAERSLPPLEFGIALHAGDVMYGNIGAPNRLDFTAIGPAVNLAARLEKLTAELGRTVVTSAEFARTAAGRLDWLGRHKLHGVVEPQDVFAPAADTEPER